MSSNISTTPVTGALTAPAKMPATPIAIKFGAYAIGMPKTWVATRANSVPTSVPMTTIGKRVPPGVPAAKHVVVKMYLPSKSAITMSSVSVAGSLIFSIMASPPQRRSGQVKAIIPASMNGIISLEKGANLVIFLYSPWAKNIPLLWSAPNKPQVKPTKRTNAKST